MAESPYGPALKNPCPAAPAGWLNGPRRSTSRWGFRCRGSSPGWSWPRSSRGCSSPPRRSRPRSGSRSTGHSPGAMPARGATWRPRPRWARRGVGQQVDLAGQPAPRAAEGLPVLVIRLSPLCAPGRSARRVPAGPGRYRRRAAPRPGRVLVRPDDRGVHGDSPCLALRLVTPGAQLVKDRLPGPVPDQRRCGYRRSSSSRSTRAGPATSTPPGSGRDAVAPSR